MTIEQWNTQLMILDENTQLEESQKLICDYMELKKQYKNNSCIADKNIFRFTKVLKRYMGYILKKNSNDGIKELDLSYEDFSGQDFSFTEEIDRDVNGMIFINGRFECTNFSNANLDTVSFWMCDLVQTKFVKAFMECAYFSKCNMTQCEMDDAHLLAAYVNECNWADASVKGTNLLEIEAKNVNIKGLNIDERTAINDGDFEKFDWSNVNVSGLSISINQVKYFNECANGGNKIKIYDLNFKELDRGSIIAEDAILDSILAQSKSWMVERNSDIEVFISYACPTEKMLASKIFKELCNKGKSVWMDTMLNHDEKLNMQLEMTLQSCREAIILLSDTYKRKAWTRYEIMRLSEESRNRGLNIIIYNLSSTKKVNLANVLDNEKHIASFMNATVVNMLCE